MQIITFLSSLVVTLVAVVLFFPLFLLLVIGLFRALLIESIKKIFRRPVVKILFQTPSSKKAAWQGNNFLRHYQHELGDAVKRQLFTEMNRIKSRNLNGMKP